MALRLVVGGGAFPCWAAHRAARAGTFDHPGGDAQRLAICGRPIRSSTRMIRDRALVVRDVQNDTLLPDRSP